MSFLNVSYVVVGELFRLCTRCLLGLMGRCVAHRNPTVTDAVVKSMSSHEEPGEECLDELRRATDRLDREGFWWRPSWPDLRAGSRPETHAEGEPGEWRHGWQYWSSSISDSYFRKGTMLSGRTAARRAHFHSHSGRNARAALAYCPTSPELTIPPHLFRTLLLERMSPPLQMTEVRCEGCHAQFDACGHHRASRPRSGWVKKRATPTEHGAPHFP